MNHEIQLTPPHCIYYIYKIFACMTDGEFHQKEMELTGLLMYEWVNKNEEELEKVITETDNWIQNLDLTDNDTIIAHMISMVDYLKTKVNFSIGNMERFLLDIRTIARADGDFCDNEKVWHDMMAAQFGIGIRVSEKNINAIEAEQKKVKRNTGLGFKMSWQK